MHLSFPSTALNEAVTLCDYLVQNGLPAADGARRILLSNALPPEGTVRSPTLYTPAGDLALRVGV